MKTQAISILSTSRAPQLIAFAASMSSSAGIPSSSAEFQEIPSNSTPVRAQLTENQGRCRDQEPGIFVEKIPASQHSGLREWQSDQARLKLGRPRALHLSGVCEKFHNLALAFAFLLPKVRACWTQS